MSVPAPAPQYTAHEFLDEVERRGGHVHRFPELVVFVLTTDNSTAAWLIESGGTPYRHPLADSDGSYMRAPDLREWDILIHRVPVAGEETIHQAAGRRREVRQVSLA